MSVSLGTIVNVDVEVNNLSSISSDFNLGCIIGSSSVLNAGDRVRLYSKDTFQAQMIADGFLNTSDEYLGAVAYFGQNPSPATLAVGVVLQEESDLQALTATRLANENIYAFAFAYETEDNELQAIAAAVQAFGSPCMFFCQTEDTNCLQTGTENVMRTLMEANVDRTSIFYSTQEQFSCGLMGVVCGLNTMTANSAYTLAYKNVAGFTPEQIDDVALAAIESYNGNVYCQFGRRYNFVYPGIMSNGYPVDQKYFLDVTQFLIQQYAVSGLVGSRRIPQTESGVGEIISFITSACEVLRVAGFIATGIWQAGTVGELETGDAVPNGYMIQAGSLADQSAADRQARKSPPIDVCLKGSGAIEHLSIHVFVNP